MCVRAAKGSDARPFGSYLDQLVKQQSEGGGAPIDEERSQMQRPRRRQQQQLTPTSRTPSQSVASSDERGEGGCSDEWAHNPLVQEQAWFASQSVPDTPIWIGEASDEAFATRFRQFASSSSSSPPPTHIPRTRYATDEMLASLARTPPSWPSMARLRFLVQSSLRSLCRSFYIVRRSEVARAVERIATDPTYADREPLMACKIWAVLAIGELHSTKKTVSLAEFPGLAYFARASSMLRMLSERPHMDVVESMLLLVRGFAFCSVSFLLILLTTFIVPVLPRGEQASLCVHSHGRGRSARLGYGPAPQRTCPHPRPPGKRAPQPRLVDCVHL
jgi:hypothetical protein